MKTKLTDLRMLQLYVAGVRKGIKHHAPKVSAVFPTLVGNVIEYGKDIEIYRNRDGRLRNSAWFTAKASGTRYSIYYRAGRVILRRGSQRGPVVAKFTNKTPLTRIQSIFSTV